MPAEICPAMAQQTHSLKHTIEGKPFDLAICGRMAARASDIETAVNLPQTPIRWWGVYPK